MKENILFTILIPVYNSELYLKRCLESIVKQSYKLIEIIIINDGSTDNSILIINDFAKVDNRIIIINKVKNEGIGSAYNDALKIAKGDYISFLDSDDFMDENFFEEIFYYCPKYDIIQFGWRYFDSNYKILEEVQFTKKIIQNNKNVIKFFFKSLKKPNLVKVIKRTLFNEIQLISQNIGIDNLITYQVINNAKSLILLDSIFYNALIRQNSVSRTYYSEKIINENINLMNHLLNIFSNYQDKYIYNNLIKEYIGIIYNLGFYYYNNNQYENLRNLINNETKFLYIYLYVIKNFHYFEIKLILKLILFNISFKLFYKIRKIANKYK